MKIAQFLTDDQKQAILAHDYHLACDRNPDVKFLVTADDGYERCPLAVALGLIYTPFAYQIAHMLGGSAAVRSAVYDFIRAADSGQIKDHADLAAALGVSHASV